MIKQIILVLVALYATSTYSNAQHHITKLQVDIDTLDIFTSNRFIGNHCLVSKDYSIIDIGGGQLSRVDNKSGELCRTVTADEVHHFIQKQVKSNDYEFYEDGMNHLLQSCSQAFVSFDRTYRIDDDLFQCEIATPVKLKNGETDYIRGYLQFDEYLNLKAFYNREKTKEDLSFSCQFGGFYQTVDTLTILSLGYDDPYSDFKPYYTRFVLDDKVYKIDSTIKILERPKRINRFGPRFHTVLNNKGRLCITNGEKMVCSSDNLQTVDESYQLTKQVDECYFTIIEVGDNQYVGGLTILDEVGTSSDVEFVLLNEDFKPVKTIHKYDVTRWYINTVEFYDGKLHFYMYEMEKNFLFFQTLDISNFLHH